MPRNFVRFLQALVRNRRQMLIPAIAHEYLDLVDRVEGRVHASVTVAREADDSDRQMIAQQLSRALGKDVVPHFHVDAGILGGLVVRVGDTVLDGSVRRRLATLRARMLGQR
jgi:F-type H+-transporting ATPase subunit delta